MHKANCLASPREVTERCPPLVAIVNKTPKDLDCGGLFFFSFPPDFDSYPEMDTITILWLNAKGVNIPEKRRILLNDSKLLHIDAAFIQETHFRDDQLPILKNRYYPVVYHSTANLAKTKGVSILLSSRRPWSCQDILTDPEGHFLFIKGLIEVKMTFASIYVPNDHQDLFLS